MEFGFPTGEPTADAAGELTDRGEALLAGIVAPLVSVLGDRIDTREGELTPIVRRLVEFGQYANAIAGQGLDPITAAVVGPARTAIAQGTAVVADLTPILAVADAPTTPQPTPAAPTVQPPAAPTTPPTTSGQTPATGRAVCPDGQVPYIEPGTNAIKCYDPMGTSVPPTVPPVVQPPAVPNPPTPVPPSPADSCTIVSTGVIGCLDGESFWLLLDCSNPAAVSYTVTKCCGTPAAGPGTSVLGPFTDPPTADEIRDKAKECVTGVPPVASPPPPAEPEEEEEAPAEEEETEPDEFDLEAEAPPVERPVPAALECAPLNYADPRVCQCLDSYVEGFQQVGRAGYAYHLWMQSAGRELNEYQIVKIEAELFGGVLAKAVAKIAFADMTLPAYLDLIMELVQSRFMKEVDKHLAESVKLVASHANGLVGPKFEALMGIYLARSFIRLLEDYQSGPFAREFTLPVGTLDLTHVHRVLDILIDYLAPIRLPSLADIEDLWRTGRISETHAECLARANGQQWGIVRAGFVARSQQPTGIDLVQYQYRQRLPEGEFLARLRELGFVDPRAVEVLRKTQAYLPPPSDAIRFAVRDVFDPAKLGRAEMLEELKAQKGLKELFEAIGLEATTIRTKDGREFPVPVDELYWLASYEECSPTQAYEMLHRLRPNRVGRFPLPGKDGKTVFPEPMDIQTVQKLLKEKDYNPIWRDRLAAISYHVPGRIDVRRMYALGVFGRPLGPEGWNAADPADPTPKGPAELEVTERYRDMGYSDIDARVLGYYTSQDYALGKVRKTQTRKQNAIIRSYLNGTIGHQEAIDRLTRVTGSAELARELTDLADVETANRRVEEVARSVRQQFLSYQLDRDGAKRVLTGAGITPVKVAELLARWEVRDAGRGREIAAGQLCGYFAAGVITREEFVARLVRAGYREDEAKRIVRKCELGELAKSQRQVAREAQAAQRAEATRQKAAEKFAKDQQRAAERSLSRRMSVMSEKNLIAFWKAGVISAEEVRGALAFKGWVPTDINRWVSTYLKGGPNDEREDSGTGD